GRRFLLRPEVLEFGSAYLSSMNIEQIVLPRLQSLRDQTGDSSSLAGRSGQDILYVAHVSTNRHIRIGAGVGTRFAWHATSLGKAIVAFQPEAVIAELLDPSGFQRFTERTITSAKEMDARLRDVRAQGY